MSLQQAEKEVGQTVEGLPAARAVYLMTRDLGLELPIMEQVYKVLYEHVKPKDAVKSLENRPQRAEHGG
jgi:glycerol-3-phosphate dehydrogenase (NAD(P)+)